MYTSSTGNRLLAYFGERMVSTITLCSLCIVFLMAFAQILRKLAPEMSHWANLSTVIWFALLPLMMLTSGVFGMIESSPKRCKNGTFRR